MSIIDIRGFRCINFSKSTQLILSGKFDYDNPCTYCTNRIEKDKPGPAFFYREFNHWEFPFIAESTCSNYKLIQEVRSKSNIISERKALNEILNKNNRINEIGKKYNINWAAFAKQDDISIFNIKLNHNGIVYPNSLNAINFYKEVGQLRSDLFEIKLNVKYILESQWKVFKITDSKLDYWVNSTEKNFGMLLNQIESLEESKHKLSHNIVSKFAFNSIAGGYTFEIFKNIVSTLYKML